MIYILSILLILSISLLVWTTSKINQDATVKRIDKHLARNLSSSYKYILHDLQKIKNKYQENQIILEDIDKLVGLLRILSDSSSLDNINDSKNEKNNSSNN